MPQKEKITVRLTLGNWQTAQDMTDLPDLNEDTLRRACKKKWKDCGKPYQTATQVLVWDLGAHPSNLIAVYTPDCDKLTIL